MPYIREYLLCQHFHWSWQDVQAMPVRVFEYFDLYRNAEAQVRNAEARASASASAG